MVERRDILKITGTTVLGVALGAGGVLLGKTEVSGAKQRKSPQRVLKFYTSWRPNFPGIGYEMIELQKRVASITGNQIVIEYVDAKDLTRAQMIKNIQTGVVDGMYSLPDFWQKQIPANLLFSAHPFGPDFDEFYEWLLAEEGNKLWQEIHQPHGIMPLAVSASRGQMGGWFVDEILSLRDLRNVPIAARGLPGMLYRAAGAKVYEFPDEEIFKKLQEGVIEGAIVGDPAYDEALGLYKVATRYFNPGFQAPVQMYQLSINLKRWQGLSISDRNLLRTAANSRLQESVATNGIQNQQAIRRLVREHNVTLREFTDETLEEITRKWQALSGQLSAKDKNFAKVQKSIKNFVLQRKNWQELSSDGYNNLRYKLFFDEYAPFKY